MRKMLEVDDLDCNAEKLDPLLMPLAMQEA